ncbi:MULTISPECIES: hypothetical protein [unclassified Clostridioides]|nr:hypothetical protein [Clostridioides sp. ES-S-0049-03]MCC0678605.1 hypothetical protein [Clostridioides sp. ES-W-0018-02]MCC0705358.1 hypothetical protein [Clostridioides sp. ES-S-0049-02]MCC0713459.1 hypothetical protein [Clostridioides sp. ES-W-0017-02]
MNTKDKKCKRCPYRKEYKRQLYVDIFCLILQSALTVSSIIKLFCN